jgi:hypothetical protein
VYVSVQDPSAVSVPSKKGAISKNKKTLLKENSKTDNYAFIQMASAEGYAQLMTVPIQLFGILIEVGSSVPFCCTFVTVQLLQ